MIKVKALVDFSYSENGRDVKKIKKGTQFDIHDRHLEGLEAEGIVAGSAKKGRKPNKGADPVTDVKVDDPVTDVT